MNVREGRPGDTEAICSVARAAWHAAYDDILGADRVEARVDEWYDPDRVRDYFEDPDVDVFVVGNPVVGYAFCRPDEGDRFHLTAIYVHPDRWGEGIGSRLLERVETTACEGGFETVELVVLADNDGGRWFYESHGYEPVGNPEESLEDGIRELVYEKRFRD